MKFEHFDETKMRIVTLVISSNICILFIFVYLKLSNDFFHGFRFKSSSLHHSL